MKSGARFSLRHVVIDVTLVCDIGNNCIALDERRKPRLTAHVVDSMGSS